MKQEKIHWKKALELLEKKVLLKDKNIIFDEKIHINNVLIFNQNKIEIPEHLINYDDKNIDCSDIPEITEMDINSGKLLRVLAAQVKIDTDTEKWIKMSNINYNDLLSKLLNNFYHSIKSLPNEANL